MAGDVRRGPKLNVGYFAQRQTDELIASMKHHLTHMARALPNGRPRGKRARSWHGSAWMRTARKRRWTKLSGGEKARLLCLLPRVTRRNC